MIYNISTSYTKTMAFLSMSMRSAKYYAEDSKKKMANLPPWWNQVKDPAELIKSYKEAFIALEAGNIEPVDHILKWELRFVERQVENLRAYLSNLPVPEDENKRQETTKELKLAISNQELILSCLTEIKK